jgi:hypothetical protein
MAITLKDYLKNNKSLQAIQKKLKAAQTALSQQQRALDGVPASAGAQIRAQIQQRFDAAQEAFDAAKADFDAAQLRATEYFNTNIEKITAESEAKTASADKDKLADSIAMRQRLIQANQPTESIDKSIQELNDRINKTGKYAPKMTKGPDLGTGTGETAFTPRDYATELATTGQAVAKMSEPQRLALANRLKAAGYNVPVTGVYNQNLIDAYTSAIVENQVRSNNFQQEIGFEAFLESKAREAAALGAASGVGGAGGAADAPYAIIANPTQAAAYVNSVVKSTLGRDATRAEIDEWGAELIAAQRKNPIKTKLNKQGVAERTGGVDPEQFLFSRIQKLPEYRERVTAENDINLQTLAKTAKANGLDLTANFDPDTINSWVKRIQNGEDPDIFKNKIRQQAFRSMPPAVRDSLDTDLDLNANFATYINSYAKTFGVPATQVDIMKIIPLATDEKGFVSIPGFEKKKRSLNEWQYTPEAKEEVSNIASKVLRDFGFQG